MIFMIQVPPFLFPKAAGPDSQTPVRMPRDKDTQFIRKKQGMEKSTTVEPLGQKLRRRPLSQPGRRKTWRSEEIPVNGCLFFVPREPEAIPSAAASIACELWRNTGVHCFRIT